MTLNQSQKKQLVDTETNSDLYFEFIPLLQGAYVIFKF